VGDALLRLLCRDASAFGVAGRAGLGFGLGAIGTSTFSLLASLLGAQAPAWPMLAGAAVLWLAARRLRPAPGAGAAAPRAGGRWRALRAALLGYLGLWLGLLAALCALEPLVEWDVIAIWGYKAKLLLRETIAETSYFGDATRAYSHLDYPLLWPLVLRGTWSFVGHADVAAIKLVGVALMLAFAGAFHGLLSLGRDPLAALLATALLVSVPIWQAQVVRLGADAPLAYFWLLCAGCSYAWLDGGGAGLLRLAGVFAVGVLLTKNEGIALFGVLAASGIATLLAGGGRARLPRFLAWQVALPLLVTAPWFVWRARVPQLAEDYAARIGPGNALAHAERLPEILTRTGSYMLVPEDWLLVWPLVALACAIGIGRLAGRPLVFLFLCAQLPLAVYAYVYAVTPWELADLMEVSASRLLLHVLPLELWLVCELARRGCAWPWSDARAAAA
jgi:hypothetical protein